MRIKKLNSIKISLVTVAIIIVAIVAATGIYWWQTRKNFEFTSEFSGATLSAASLISSPYFKVATSHINPEEALRFNPKKNSGWVYIAQTVPDYYGRTFWVAAVRSLSTNATDTSAQLLYGITNARTGTYYPGFLDGGSFSEDPNKVNITYVKSGKTILKFWQTKTDLSEFRLEVSLPSSTGGYYKTTKTLTLKRPILYESGDGIVPMGGGIDSLYVSLIPEGGFWIDFQKFNISSLLQMQSRYGGINHRWMSFILNKPIGLLPAGTVGVGWEILDANNQRQPGGYTNVDLLIPGYPQITASESQINLLKIDELQTWNSGHKTYLKKWKIIYPGIELLFETLIPNQENKIINNYFYEGAIKVMNPKTGEQIGTGMLEQTHNEASDK